MNMDLSITKEFNVFNFDKVARELFKQSFFLTEDKVFVKKNNEIPRWALDCRIALSKSPLSRYVCERISDYLDKNKYTTLAVKGFGGIFIGSGVIQYGKHKNLLVIRDSRKEYGFKNIVEGYSDKKDTICIVDDILNSGNSVLESVNILRSEGYIVDRSLSIFKYDWSTPIHIDNFKYEHIISIKESL